MRGEFIGIWSELKREIWEPLAQLEDAPDDLFCELFRTISVAFNVQLSAEELANIVDNTFEARDAFYALTTHSFSNERALALALEQISETLDELNGEALCNPYFLLLEAALKNLAFDTSCVSHACFARPYLAYFQTYFAIYGVTRTPMRIYHL